MTEDIQDVPLGPKKEVRYIDVDVLTEAGKRINHIIDSFDTVVVCFSGGKDSLTVLHLFKEIYEERGGIPGGRIKVLFRDEELIPDDIVDFVHHYRSLPWIDMAYYAVPMLSEKFILGRTYEYVQWDPGREWIRSKPDFAIKETGLGRAVDQHQMDEFTARIYPGKVAFVNGIRCDESLVRYRSVVNKKNECFIAASDNPRVKLCKPIYDWSENDIFRYFYDRGIQYCPIYDVQMWNNQNLRVATPLHAEAAKRFGKMRTLYPVFYQQLISLFPEMLVQERYWDEYDRWAVIDRYPRSWEGIVRYIRENIPDPLLRKKAIRRVFDCRTIRENNLARGRGLHNYGGYPILYVFKTIVAGSFERMIQPCSKPGKDVLEYEKGSSWDITERTCSPSS